VTVGREVVIAGVEEAEGLPMVLLEHSLMSHSGLTICQDQNDQNDMGRNITKKW
jgi:hypothetical protein